MGTVFGYTQFDAVARYHRMRGRNVFFPIGWDDNGLATERRVQNYYGVRCDPTQPYDPDFAPPYRGDVPRRDHQRGAGVAAQLHRPVPGADGHRRGRLRGALPAPRHVVRLDDAVHHHRRPQPPGQPGGLPPQPRPRRGLQRRGPDRVGRRRPHRRRPGRDRGPRAARRLPPHRLPRRRRRRAHRHDAAGADRELRRPRRPPRRRALPAAVRHDGAHAACSTSRFRSSPTPSPSRTRAPASPWSAPSATPPTSRGGASSTCPTRSVIGRDGRFLAATPAWLDSDAGTRRVRRAGRPDGQAGPGGDGRAAPRVGRAARRAAAAHAPGEVLRARQPAARDRHQPPVVHPQRRARPGPPRDVPRPRQGAGVVPRPHAPPLRPLGGGAQRRLAGQPPALLRRADPAVVPGRAPTARSTTTTRSGPTRPRCRSTRRPTCRPGYTAAQRGAPGGFVGDPDIMDTWATSSLTPQIAAGWVDEPELFARVFPMDLRPQGPEIIRTWLFATVVRSHYEHGSLPWANTMINGWILDPDRKKMSKSQGNVVTPMGLFERYGTDAVRYWATSARPGVDTAFSEDQMKVGRRLATKLLNVTKFVLVARRLPRPTRRRRDPVDLAMLARLDATVAEAATVAFDGLRLRPCARAHRGAVLVVLRRLRRAGEEPGVRLTGATGRGIGGGRAARRARRAAAPVRPDAAVRGRRGVELVARLERARRGLADGDRRPRRPVARRGERRARPRAPGQDRGQGEPAGDRGPTRPRRPGGVARRDRTRPRRPGGGAHRRDADDRPRRHGRRWRWSWLPPDPAGGTDGAVTLDRCRCIGPAPG